MSLYTYIHTHTHTGSDVNSDERPYQLTDSIGAGREFDH